MHQNDSKRVKKHRSVTISKKRGKSLKNRFIQKKAARGRCSEKNHSFLVEISEKDEKKSDWKIKKGDEDAAKKTCAKSREEIGEKLHDFPYFSTL